MALAFTTNGRYVEHGSDGTIDTLDPYTVIHWVRPNPASAGGFFSMKGNAPAGTRRIFFIRTAGDALRVVLDRATDDLIYETSTTIADDAWSFVAATFDSGGGANEIVDIFTGNRSTKATEVAYFFVQDGGGAFGDDQASNLRIGDNFDNDAAFPGRIALTGLWASILTLAQIQAQQRSLWPIVDLANLRLFCNYGWTGTGAQPDWSGNGNNGTVTGATVAPHVPLPLFPASRMFTRPAIVGNPWHAYAQQ